LDNRRLLVAAILSVTVLFVWQILFPPPEPPQRPAEAVESPSAANNAAASTPSAGEAVAPPGAASPAVPPEAGATSPAVPPTPIADTEERRVVLENDAVRAELSNRGAQLVSLRLKDKKLADGTLLELVGERSTSPYPLALVGEDGAPHPLDGALHRVETDERPAGQSAFFSYRGAEGAVEKRVTLAADGRLEIELKVAGGLGKGGLVLGPGLRVRNLEELESKIVRRAAVYRLAGTVEVVDAHGVEEPTRLPAAGLDWIGLEDTYFLAAVVDAEGLAEARIEPVALEPNSGGKSSFDAVPFVSADNLPQGLKGRPRDLRLVLTPAGETLELTTIWSAKQFDRLEGFGVGLEQTVRWGWLGFLARPLLRALQWIHAHLAPNYGWAIVLLTAALKIVLLPLSIASFKSMRKMQKLNPKMQAIREKWRPKLRDKNGRFVPDAQRQMNEEVMGLYRQEGVNPAGGCLPILVQLPIFFAFYQLLSTAVELWQAPWVLWVEDLTAHDPYYVLPIVMGLTQVIQQRMTPPPPDPMQKRLMQFLPIVFTVFSLGFASGLVLYWLTNNVLSIAQQAIYNRIQERHEGEAAVAAKPDKAKKKKA
jgi:YidC/Oxa1 family membrane protein insertase